MEGGAIWCCCSGCRNDGATEELGRRVHLENEIVGIFLRGFVVFLQNVPVELLKTPLQNHQQYLPNSPSHRSV